MSERDPTADETPEERSRGDAEDAETPGVGSRGDAEDAEVNQAEEISSAISSAISAPPRDNSPRDDDALREQTPDEIDAIVEALIFASPEPLTRKALAKLLDTEPSEDVEAALARVMAQYERPGGLQLVQVAGGYQIVTRPELHEWVRRLFHERTTQKLSVQALETLSVIAYKQPVTAAEITEIRGVNTSGVLNTLLERQLIKIAGRKQVVGRPFLYATTREFLIRFGLKDLADLPKIEDMADVLGFEPPAALVGMPEGFSGAFPGDGPVGDPDEARPVGAPHYETAPAADPASGDDPDPEDDPDPGDDREDDEFEDDSDGEDDPDEEDEEDPDSSS